MQESPSENQASKADAHGAVIEVTRDDLPVHCPMDETTLWSSHPRVFIPLEDTGEAVCPYCGTVYKLVD